MELKLPDVTALRTACSQCSLADLCVPMGLDDQDLKRLDSLVSRGAPMRAGQQLFRAGDTFHCLYAVRGGVFKSTLVDENGEERVLGFHLPGELMGLDAIDSGEHRCSATALDAASVCMLPFQQLSDLAAQVPGLQQQLFRLLSRDICARTDQTGERSADERLALFLESLARRLQMRGYSAVRFNLPMSRAEIASYLGLANETVSRILKRLQKAGVLSVKQREVHILDSLALERVAHPADC